MPANCAFIDGFIRSVNVAEGSLLKAALVGAKTVNGPVPLAWSARPAATRAFSSVECSDDKPALVAKSLPVEPPIVPDEEDILPDDDDIPDAPVCEPGDIVPEEFDIPDVPVIDDIPLVPDIDDVPLVPDIDAMPLVLVCERGVVVLVVWPTTIPVAPITRTNPKIACLIIK